jgi:sugar lactone lactonase YvrE
MKPKIVSEIKSSWGEGPIWANGFLYYVDIENQKILKYNPKDESTQSWNVGQRVGTVVPREKGGLVWAGDHGFYFLNEESGESTAIVDPEKHNENNRFNDGKCDPQGRFWAGTYDFKKQATGGLYSLDLEQRLQKRLGEVTASNGLIWSLDEKIFYYIDTIKKNVRSYDYDSESGELSGEQVIWDTAGLEGSPDGMTIDEQGNLWVAFCHAGCVRCYDVSRRQIIAEINFPCIETTAVAFGGDDLGDLYVTTGIKPGLEELGAGYLYRCRPGVKGVKSYSYQG